MLELHAEKQSQNKEPYTVQMSLPLFSQNFHHIQRVLSRVRHQALAQYKNFHLSQWKLGYPHFLAKLPFARKLDLNPVNIFFPPSTKMPALGWKTVVSHCGFWKKSTLPARKRVKRQEKNKIKDHFPNSNKAENQRAVSEQLEINN